MAKNSNLPPAGPKKAKPPTLPPAPPQSVVDPIIETQPRPLANEERRNFMVVTATAMTGVGAACAVWPLLDTLNPSADVLALATVEQDISAVQPGQTIKLMWQGKPVFIRRRTPAEVEEARAVPMKDLPDPQEDQSRIKAGKDEWLVTVGICTHLGCVPISGQGEYHGWFCPCHGSHYDTSGRIRKGPAPKNLAVPPYEFISDTVIRIG